ncbi:hypothetical protein Z043_117701, partial [Scleropages formosus]
MTSPVCVIVVGAGSRGKTYSQFALLHPQRMRVVGVADPNPFARKSLQAQHRVSDDHTFDDWHRLVEREKFADAVFICTPDRLHKEPAVALAKQGYHILLEKPMAEVIDSGVLGDVIHIQHFEPVGFFHFAHSFVRGNWRNEAESSFALLAKCCHDIDLIHHWAGGRRCVKVSSFGALSHFTKENKVSGNSAGERCLDCPVEVTCPYSACKIYLERVKKGFIGWPASVLCSSSVTDIESVTEALRTGPYGRCVYNCDNDVCSNQVVNMEFEGGLTASFSMVAFTEEICQRRTTIHGSKGQVCYDQHGVRVFEFLTQRTTWLKADTGVSAGFGDGGHGVADYHLVDSFISAVAKGDPSLIRSGPEETLRSHKLVFEAERARLEN